ncbi:Putative two-component system response regulator%2C LuxR family [Mycobacteroides abscessus]|nr:Putative two-component system response regulator%2C LuxR family [Mycobacteroides abscessus]
MTGNTDSEQISVMVVDDHPMWRDGVSRDLQAAGLRVVATADGVASSGRIAATVKPDVVLMDMQLTDGDGAQATAAVLSASPHSHILVLSASAEREDVLEAVKAGATGYLVKSASAAELIDAVRATAKGQAVFTPGLAGLVLGEFRRMSSAPAADADETPRLSDRETEVLRLVAKRGEGQADRHPAFAEPPDCREPCAVDAAEAAIGQSCRADALRDRARARRIDGDNAGYLGVLA